MSIDYSTWQIELKSGSDTRVDNVHEIREDDAGLTKLFDREGGLIFMAPTASVSFMKCLQKPARLPSHDGITVTTPNPEAVAEALARQNDPRYRGQR